MHRIECYSSIYTRNSVGKNMRHIYLYVNLTCIWFNTRCAHKYNRSFGRTELSIAYTRSLCFSLCLCLSVCTWYGVVCAMAAPSRNVYRNKCTKIYQHSAKQTSLKCVVVANSHTHRHRRSSIFIHCDFWS